MSRPRLGWVRLPSKSLLRRATGVVLIALPLALGGAHPEVNAALAVIMVALLGLAAWQPEARRVRVTLPVALPVLALGITIVQVVPVPESIIRVIAPGAHDVLEMSLGDGYGWAPLSMEPPETYHEILKLISYVAAALLVPLLFHSPRRQRQLLGWMIASGVGVVAFGFVRGLTQLDLPHGASGPQGTSFFASSFINPNHLAGFLGFCSILGVGLIPSSQGTQRLACLAASVLSGLGVFLSLSRGGILAYLVALIGLGFTWWMQRRNVRRGGWVLLLGFHTALALALASYLTQALLIKELETLGDENVLAKAEIWRPVPSLLRAFPALGVGRGAFAAIYPKYYEGNLWRTYTHLENEWLQALVDWGPLFGACLLAGLIFSFVRLLGRVEQLPAVAAFLFIGVSNLGSFNLTLTSVCLPAVMVWSASFLKPHRSGQRPRLAARANMLRLSAFVLGTAAAIAAVPAVTNTLNRDLQRLPDALAHAFPTTTQAPNVAPLYALIHRHPADYIIPLRVARHLLATRADAKQALRWINKSMYLAPRFTGSHHLAGHILFQLGAVEQALLEFRLACELAPPNQCSNVLAGVWSLRNRPGDLRTVGVSQDPVVRFTAARELLRKKYPAEAIKLLEDPALPDTPELFTLRAEAYFRAGSITALAALADEFQKKWPTHHDAYSWYARALAQANRPSEALAQLEPGIAQAVDVGPLLFHKAQILRILGDLKEARKVAQELTRRVPLGGKGAEAAWLLGSIYNREGRRLLALREYERAAKLAPWNLEYRLEVVALRVAMGDLHAARRELEKAKERFGAHPRITETLERLATVKTESDVARTPSLVDGETN